MQFLRVFWRSTVGLKAVVAVSGVVLSLWVLAHLLGNMTLFAGAAAADGYAAGLRRWPALLWTVRAGLAAAAAIHVAAIAALARRAQAAQPGHPRPHRAGAATLASRTMRAGGVLLLVFVVLHLLHLTFGALHPGFVPGRVFDNVVAGLGPPLVAAGYLVACALLGLHLYHGLWSATRSLGVGQRSAAVRRRPLVAALAMLTALGFAAVPVAVLAGVLR